MKKISTFYRVLAMLLAVLLCGIPTIFASAANDRVSERNMMYTVDGIDAYKEPYAASQRYEVDQLIYFTTNQAPAELLDDSRVAVVSTMDELVATAKEEPFAALVVTAEAEPLLDRDKLVQLSQTQHILLIIGFDTASEEDLSRYTQLTGNSTENYVEVPGFASYYVVSATGEISLWDMIWGQDLTVSDLLNFAENSKDSIFYLYDSFVLQAHPEFVEEINNAEVPAVNVIAENNLTPNAAWDPAVNNSAEIFNPRSTLPDLTMINVYADTNSGTKIMSSYVGEALLFNGTKVLVNDYYWYSVRGWKQTGSSSTFITGWIRGIGSRVHTVQTECYSLYTNGGRLAQENVAGVTYDRYKDAVGYTLTSAAKLYDSSGTLLLTLSQGNKVWLQNDEGYAGATKPYLISISAYTTSDGVYHIPIGTVFADLNFDSGNTGTYRIVTHS